MFNGQKIKVSDEDVKKLMENKTQELTSYNDCLLKVLRDVGGEVWLISNENEIALEDPWEEEIQDDLEGWENSLTCKSRAKQLQEITKALLVCDAVNGKNHVLSTYNENFGITRIPNMGWDSTCSTKLGRPFVFYSREKAEQFIKIIGKESLDIIFGYTKP